MTKIRFIDKDGQSVDSDIVRNWFFESATDAGIDHDAEKLWLLALDGDEELWALIEEVCEVEIVKDEAGFGFSE